MQPTLIKKFELRLNSFLITIFIGGFFDFYIDSDIESFLQCFILFIAKTKDQCEINKQICVLSEIYQLWDFATAF